MNAAPQYLHTMPRERMRLRFRDLLPGELAWASFSSCRIDPKDLRVWLREDDTIDLVQGDSPPDASSFSRNEDGLFLIERTGDGWMAHVYGDAVYSALDMLDGWQEDGFVVVKDVVDHGPRYHTCPLCQGRGILVSGTDEDAK